MAKVRVYELAKELGVESRMLLAYLVGQGQFVRSASSIVEQPAVDRIRSDPPLALLTTGPAQSGPPPRIQSTTCWLDDDEYSWPDEMTAIEAASMCGVRPSTIRQWVGRGYLRPIGRKGRSSIFATRAVRGAQDRVQERTPKAPPARRGIASKDLDRLVTTAVAARVAGVSPSTIRMWVYRGLLTPVPSPSRSHTFIVQDVLRTTHRGSPRRGWRDRQ